MAITSFRVRGYRSIFDLSLELGRVNVLVGPNGCGKSNLYRSMLLMAEAARGGLSQAFAAEGGYSSAIWAGEKKSEREAERICLEARIDELEYRMECGLPSRDAYKKDERDLPVYSAFGMDPEIKLEEVLVHGEGGKPVRFLSRRHRTAKIVDCDGTRRDFPVALDRSESAVSQLRDPESFPVLFRLREELAGFRFYHQFRTDLEAPIRQAQLGTFTPILAHDGRDAAAALQSVFEHSARAEELAQEAVSRAVSGAELLVDIDRDRALFEIKLRMPGLSRDLAARELSDGTLRFVCLLAALLSPRPPGLLALNEPETSLHPDLIEPLADLIVEAASRSQIWLTTHSRALADRIAEQCGEAPIELEIVGGRTKVIGRDFIGRRRQE